MSTLLQTRLGLRAGAACVAAVLATGLCGQPAHANDLPPPQVRARTSVGTSTPTRGPTRVVPTRSTTPAPPRPGFVSGKPSEPVTQRGARRHSTYVPPLGASARRPAPAVQQPASVPQMAQAVPTPARTRAGRVPVTTFRVAPAPTPRRVAALPRAPAPVSAPRQAVRRTTWSPRPIPVAPTSAPRRTSALPAPAVAKVSPSYADLERTRAHSVTARQRPQAGAARRRTLQRRPATSTLKRRAVRSGDLSVPMAPGQCAPRQPVRRSLPLVPPPGCDGGG
jgi:hypothetical protein